MNTKTNDIMRLVLTALMMSLVFILTYSIRVPVPATNGYIHLGDSMIFISVILLGWKYGALASALGSALSDFLAGYNHYVPVTFLIKGLMAIAMGLLIEKAIKKSASNLQFKLAEIFGMILAGCIMIGGYYVAESFMYGSWITPLAAIPMNGIQFITGIILAVSIIRLLEHSPAEKMMTYTPESKLQ